MSALASDGQPSPVSQPAIAADVHHPLDVHLNLFAQIALDVALRRLYVRETLGEKVEIASERSGHGKKKLAASA